MRAGEKSEVFSYGSCAKKGRAGIIPDPGEYEKERF